ncbi:hypothetical protein GGS23DRAFT_353293 [Durotheca rogersii]|uniref:uncharacterized protein n=1 Tax=Durotheca rogersii TaxID=419775 RepID=UPI00221F5042|nr:uncharacterized protein GGS23DRAFT_353293 [Durotheca rogersii]KAI5865751.1 hypothetical protein GGS23DRAFT_353293 [Durotheca rogersii]
MTGSLWVTAIEYGFISFVTVLAVKYFTSRRALLQHDVAMKSAREQRDIASFKECGATDLSSRLAARAAPNARLVDTFGIVNSFTTSMPDVHSKFLREARGFINRMNNDAGWTSFSHTADGALGRALARFGGDAAPGADVPLARIARVFVFITILAALFGVNPDAVDVDDADAATLAINRLWVASKNWTPNGENGSASTTTALADGLQRDKETLEEALRRLLPNRVSSVPEDHPLNLIMPAYETMWRVALLAFVSAGFRAGRETRRMFHEVMDSVPECFKEEGEKQATALAFAKEALRLYPPTKRIYRAARASPLSSQLTGPASTPLVTVAADVEKIQRDVRIWGADAARFVPARFLGGGSDSSTRARRAAPLAASEAYMPFGVAPHECPAARSLFGYRALVVLAAALGRRLGTAGTGASVELPAGGCEANREREKEEGKRVEELDDEALGPLRSGREDMEGWVLTMAG